jgi:hypothetical protein
VVARSRGAWMSSLKSPVKCMPSQQSTNNHEQTFLDTRHRNFRHPLLLALASYHLPRLHLSFCMLSFLVLSAVLESDSVHSFFSRIRRADTLRVWQISECCQRNLRFLRRLITACDREPLCSSTNASFIDCRNTRGIILGSHADEWAHQ